MTTSLSLSFRPLFQIRCNEEKKIRGIAPFLRESAFGHYIDEWHPIFSIEPRRKKKGFDDAGRDGRPSFPADGMEIGR